MNMCFILFIADMRLFGNSKYRRFESLEVCFYVLQRQSRACDMVFPMKQ